MNKNLEELIESNWDEIKGNIKSQWGKFSNQDIKQMEGSYDILVGKLKRTYGYTKDEIENEIEEFLSTSGIDKVKEKVKNTVDEAKEKASNWKDVVEEYVGGCLEGMLDKTSSLEKNVVLYAKENPMKVIGIAAVLGYVLTKCLKE